MFLDAKLAEISYCRLYYKEYNNEIIFLLYKLRYQRNMKKQVAGFFES